MERSWIPVPGTTTGRLVAAALELFGAHGFDAISVGTIAAHAGVTTGSLYHHFGSKAELYHLVRADVERRVLDRLEGATSARPVRVVADLAPVLLVGFDYLVSSGFTRLLAEAAPERDEGSRKPDEIERFVKRVIVRNDAPLESLIAAAWRSALLHASDTPDDARRARRALQRLLAGR